MFGYRVGFSGTADLNLMALFSIWTNSRWRPPRSTYIVDRIARSSLR